MPPSYTGQATVASRLVRTLDRSFAVGRMHDLEALLAREHPDCAVYTAGLEQADAAAHCRLLGAVEGRRRIIPVDGNAHRVFREAIAGVLAGLIGSRRIGVRVVGVREMLAHFTVPGLQAERQR